MLASKKIAPLKKHMGPKDIARFSSPYLSTGRKKDVWEILHIDIDGDVLTAQVKMSSHYVSPTDPEGFHLTPFSALEFLSQLVVILVHVRGGYPEKTQEVWMVSSALQCKRAIRDPQNIQVQMRITSIKKVKGKILIETASKVFDKNGLFEVELKGLLS